MHAPANSADEPAFYDSPDGPRRGARDPHPGAAGRIRLLVLDIDGTVSNSRHEIDEATVRAVARVREAGIAILLATGRRYRDVLAVATRLGIEGPLVTASGALVKRTSDHATLFRASFDSRTLVEVLARIDARGLEPILYTDSFAEGFDFHCRRLSGLDGAGPPGGVGEYLALNRHLARIDPDLDRQPPTGVFAGFTMGGRDAMLDLERELDQACPDRLALHVIRSPRYRDWMCEIAPAGVTKWSGVAAIAMAAGIQPEEICAVGDDVNDLPMIRAAGLGIAMGNALPEVQAAADLVVSSHDDGGIGDVAEILIGHG
jgi:hydroxymethylpyrimidine pyrophosphatase-like HAD family hydrolase